MVWANIGGRGGGTGHILSHARHVSWRCFHAHGTKGVERMSGRRTAVIMVISDTVESGVHARMRGRGLRTAPAWKRLWPGNAMRPLEEPTPIAELRACVFSRVYFWKEKKGVWGRTNFPWLSIERRHVVVSTALQLKHWRRMPSPSFILASSV
jgi:hypothetical protein